MSQQKTSKLINQGILGTSVGSCICKSDVIHHQILEWTVI
jgi:hypothetical protein